MQAKMPDQKGHFRQFIAHYVPASKLNGQYEYKKAPQSSIFRSKNENIFGRNQ